MAEPCRGCREREKNPDWFLNTDLLANSDLCAGTRGQHQAGQGARSRAHSGGNSSPHGRQAGDKLGTG